MQPKMLGAKGPSATATDLPCKTSEGSRDVEAEVAALSLARRRGKCAPSVDTKLADAWLGFYVALTKSASRPTEAATQASTEATEASLSEVASSIGDDATPLTSGSQRESWADLSDDDDDEQTPKKRSRRSHRRRRTRGRGRKGRRAATGESPEEECTPIDEEEDSSTQAAHCHLSSHETTTCVLPVAVTSPCCAQVTSTSFTTSTPISNREASTQWPFQSQQADGTCAQARLPGCPPLPISSPSKACKDTIGMLTSTSPNAVQTPINCEASARTPPRVAFSGSPVAHMMPSTPTAFGTPTYQGGHAAYQGSHIQHMVVASPGSLYMGLASPGQTGQTPTFFTFAPPPSPVSPELCTAAGPSGVTATPTVDAMRSWLTGGLVTNDSDLAVRLHAALPEVYED